MQRVQFRNSNFEGRNKRGGKGERGNLDNGGLHSVPRYPIRDDLCDLDNNDDNDDNDDSDDNDDNDDNDNSVNNDNDDNDDSDDEQDGPLSPAVSLSSPPSFLHFFGLFRVLLHRLARTDSLRSASNARPPVDMHSPGKNSKVRKPRMTRSKNTRDYAAMKSSSNSISLPVLSINGLNEPSPRPKYLTRWITQLRLRAIRNINDRPVFQKELRSLRINRLPKPAEF